MSATFALVLCAIVLSLSSNYGSAHSSISVVSNVHFPKVPKDCDYANTDTEMANRLELIRDMTREAWRQHQDISGNGEKGLKMVQMLSTLLVMGLKDEYECGKRWIEEHYNSCDVLKDQYYTFVASTEYMGSLLSCFALTNDTTLLDRAKQIGDKLKVEFDTNTGLPNRLLSSRRSFYSSDEAVYLAHAGGQHLEFVYLADMTNDLSMKAKVQNARTFLKNVKKPNNGLYRQLIDVVTGEWIGDTSNLFWPGSVFYQYLVKSYIQSSGQDGQAMQMYSDAIDAVVNNLLVQRSCQSESQLTYAVQEANKVSTNMDYDGCYLGAMLALGADAMQKQLDESPSTVTNVIQQQTRIEQHWALAKAITETCHKHSNSSETKLPSRLYYGNVFTFETAAAYAESYFVLWRLTQETKYRDYAWELARAIHKQCRSSDGQYYHLYSVGRECSLDRYSTPALHFLSATLKYLYLTFSDDSLLPLDQWVFNRVGQALPIRGKNGAYPAKGCISTLIAPLRIWCR